MGKKMDVDTLKQKGVVEKKSIKARGIG